MTEPSRNFALPSRKGAWNSEGEPAFTPQTPPKDLRGCETSFRYLAYQSD